MPAAVPGSTPAGTAAPAGDVRAALLEGVPRTVATPRNRTARYLTGAIVAAILLTGAGLVQARLRGSPPPELAAAWRPVTPVGSAPAGYYGSRAVLDSTGNALLVFGGVADLARHALVPLGEEYWRLRGLGAGDGAAWTRITPAAGPHPAARWLFGVSSDAAHDRVIVHGGALGFTSPCANDTWVLDHASAVGHAAAWRRVVVRGPAPPARADFDQVFDARRLRLIVFAGHDCFYPSYEDTWVLSFDDSSLSSGTWRALAPDSSAGLPVRRDSYTAAYDTNTERLFIFGGRASTVPTGEIWELEHAGGAGGVPAWHPVRCGGEAPVITSPASTMDPASDTWTVFGGIDANRQPTRSVWRLTGVLRDVAHCRWERLASADPSPAARYGASAAVLPRSGEMVIFGGEFVNTPLSDAWVLRAANPMAAGTRGPVQ